MLHNYHDTFHPHSFKISIENTDVCQNHLQSSISCDTLNINTIITLRCTISWGWLTRWISFSNDPSWIMGTGSNTCEMTKTILHHCFCTNYNWIIPLINISTQTKLSTQQEFLQVPISICIVESMNNVSIMDSLAPTVHTSLRVEYTNHYTILFPFPLHPNTDTWCTSTSLSSFSHVLIHTLGKSLSPPLRMTHNSTKNSYAIIGSAGNSM